MHSSSVHHRSIIAFDETFSDDESYTVSIRVAKSAARGVTALGVALRLDRLRPTDRMLHLARYFGDTPCVCQM